MKLPGAKGIASLGLIRPLAEYLGRSCLVGHLGGGWGARRIGGGSQGPHLGHFAPQPGQCVEDAKTVD